MSDDPGPADSADLDLPAGPRWDGTRLRWALPLLYGTNRRGHPDAHAAASSLGVSTSTVYRWLARPDTELPPDRAAQLCAAVLPDPIVLRREHQAFDNAVRAIDRSRLPRGRGVDPMWREQNWLEPHLVVTVHADRSDRRPAVGPVRLLQPTSARITGRSTDDLKRRGPFLDYTTVASRFHAVTLIHLLLHQVEPWRIQARISAAAPDVGATWTYSSDAPTVPLDALATTLVDWLNLAPSLRPTFT